MFRRRRCSLAAAFRAVALAVAIAIAAPQPGGAAPTHGAARAAIQGIASTLCSQGLDDPEALAHELAGYSLADVEDSGPPGRWQRREVRLVSAEAELALVAVGLRVAGALGRIEIEARALAGDRPLMLALSDGECGILGGRAVGYENDRPSELLVLGPDLATVAARQLLDPPVPPGQDTGGVTVAQVDSGVNYLLPQIASRLARDLSGRSLGYDFWDLDPRPFDGDTGRSAFFPLRHGTEVASLLLSEAPQVRLLPFRYPRPDMSRMADLIAHARAAGADIAAVPMGSRSPSDWTAFAAAAQAQADMLFIVSAGNNGQDIDRVPVYPAALALDNLIVVTSAAADGSLAPGSNWGRFRVDLLVTAEGLTVTAFDGRESQASGSSFAVPRVAALAARLKAAHPGWGAAELRDAIFARAVAPPAGAVDAVAVGWLSETALKSR